MAERHRWVRVWRGGSIYITGHGDGFSVTREQLQELIEDAKAVLDGTAEVQVPENFSKGETTIDPWELKCANCGGDLAPTEQTRFCTPGCRDQYGRVT